VGKADNDDSRQAVRTFRSGLGLWVSVLGGLPIAVFIWFTAIVTTFVLGQAILGDPDWHPVWAAAPCGCGLLSVMILLSRRVRVVVRNREVKVVNYFRSRTFEPSADFRVVRTKKAFLHTLTGSALADAVGFMNRDERVFAAQATIFFSAKRAGELCDALREAGFAVPVDLEYEPLPNLLKEWLRGD
jgi:hypothetical protein